MEWISIEEQLPRFDERVLVITLNGYWADAYRVESKDDRVLFREADSYSMELRDVTHWFIPEPPKE